jgi:hypothetical protein
MVFAFLLACRPGMLENFFIFGCQYYSSFGFIYIGIDKNMHYIDIIFAWGLRGGVDLKRTYYGALLT